MAKFDKVTPKVPWTPERIQAQIKAVWEEIGAFNQELNSIDSKVSGLLECKQIVRRKIGDKRKYINQLESQLNEGKDVVYPVNEFTEQLLQRVKKLNEGKGGEV